MGILRELFSHSADADGLHGDVLLVPGAQKSLEAVGKSLAGLYARKAWTERANDGETASLHSAETGVAVPPVRQADAGLRPSGVSSQEVSVLPEGEDAAERVIEKSTRPGRPRDQRGRFVKQTPTPGGEDSPASPEGD